MSKRKVSSILVLETLMVGCCSLVGGLLLGVGVSQLLSLFIIQIFQVDMTQFSFVFSEAALRKTLIYFGLTFLLVMVFNVANLSKYKLIDLLTAHRKNETITLRNKKLTFFLFLLSLGLFACAYFLLFSGGLIESLVGITFLPIALCGILGTYLFFLSLADFFLSLVQKSKTFYFKGLRIFILRQLNNKINTNVASITVISLLLLFTIGILSASISIATAYNTNIEQNNLSDFTLHETFYALGEPQHVDLAPIINDEAFQTYVKDFAQYTLYESEDITLESLLPPALVAALGGGETEKTSQTKIPMMKESEFQRLMTVLNKPEYVIDISPEQYLLSANLDQMVAYYQQTLQEQRPLTLQGKVLIPATKNVLITALENSSVASNMGLIVVDDSLLLQSEKLTTSVVGNYLTSPEEMESDFSAFLTEKLKRRPSTEFFTTREAMADQSLGIGMTVSFI
jgi:putative ABC transport system permease protein